MGMYRCMGLSCREGGRTHVILQINRGQQDSEGKDYSTRNHEEFLFRTEGNFVEYP